MTDEKTGKNRSSGPKSGGKKPGGHHQPRMKMDDKPGLEARVAASKLLAAVLETKTSLDGMLDQDHGNPVYKALNEADRALVRAILNTALRFLPRIENIIAGLLDTPLPQGAKSLHYMLIVGATQILYLDIPDHSAVDLAVEQANRDPRANRFARLVNAILRRITREKDDLLADSVHVVAMPDWFFKRLKAIYGEAEAKRICEAQLTPAAIDLTVKDEADAWAQKLSGTVLPTGSVRLSAFSGAVTALDGFEDGQWWVQDAAASLPVQMFGALHGKRAVDLCAAPGGKTAQLICAGAKVTAVEQSANRLKRLAGNLARLGLEAELVQSNLLAFKPEQGFDIVLLDAPCSSTGTTRRHPDVLYTKSMEDITKLSQVQEQLLRHAITLLNPGGEIVFSNCSLDPQEGELMVERLLKDEPGLQRVPVDPARFHGLEDAITEKGEFRTTPAMLTLEAPFSSGLDGFYAVHLRKA